ncbi:MAG: hypothetical protein U5O16_41380 [Rhodococcus sp. (in: high G+C Gram-positive bacteria)]|uniref:hypothetical protein n=1 Tax=Rhodococcus sp. TaxID=1831 RepID=UPI002AD8BCFB|nr:hypothetical protein [Rhodococcus sp. (in: high G+C Gram-positive bacteria)]
MESVRSGAAELALIPRLLTPPDLLGIHIGRQELKLIVPAGYGRSRMSATPISTASTGWVTSRLHRGRSGDHERICAGTTSAIGGSSAHGVDRDAGTDDAEPRRRRCCVLLPVPSSLAVDTFVATCGRSI